MFPFASGLMLSHYPLLTASASPSSVSGNGSNAGAITITSNSTTITAGGGLPPFSYSWARLSGSFTITSPTAASTTFSESLSPGSDSGTARCTVASADGQVRSVDVAVTLTNTAPNPPAWNVANGTNMGTWVRGAGPQVAALYASVSNTHSDVYYSLPGDFPYVGGTGPEPGWPTGVSWPQGPGHGGLFGSASAGLTPGDYDATVTALNPDDGSSSTISITVTIA